MRKTFATLFAGLLTLGMNAQDFDAAYAKTEPVLHWGAKL